MKSDVTTKNQGPFGFGSQKRGFSTNFSAGRPLFWMGTGWYVYWDDTPAQDDNQWHHWMLYIDIDTPSNWTLHVDGELLDVSAVTANVQGGHCETGGARHTQELTIGANRYDNNNVYHFEGSITNFAVYSGDKTANAVSHYNNGIPKDLTGEVGLEGYWKFDEGSGETVKDHSGNGYNGTVEWNTRSNNPNDSELDNCSAECSDGGPSWITVMEVSDDGNII